MRLFSVLGTLGLGLLFCVAIVQVTLRDASAADSDAITKTSKVYLMNYRLEGLPVWSKDGSCNPKLLMMVIESSISPESWTSLGGPSTMAPYPKTASLVVSTTRENHDAIGKLLEQLRR